jgi:hypothetical protein
MVGGVDGLILGSSLYAMSHFPSLLPVYNIYIIFRIARVPGVSLSVSRLSLVFLLGGLEVERERY